MLVMYGWLKIAWVIVILFLLFKTMSQFALDKNCSLEIVMYEICGKVIKYSFIVTAANIQVKRLWILEFIAVASAGIQPQEM